ncbi:unnamed protein product [Caenorhabditis bovis]|uniref:Chorein N-terminal domain-containing protein n=1 Tax=Caenorhabditis bovis TaxID=2654633 RepID=A0A8S1FFE6_9PELO|nr:unnamed protein product [Caenorhabditis bovis]
MLENIVAWVLNNYIGEYLEDLNTDQLSVALLSGQVELENVPLKKTALRKLDLPLEVRSGLLGKLTLSVPITHIRSQPWTLKLSDVLIIVGPLSAEKRYDVQAVEQVEQQRKEQMLEELELRHKTALFDMLGIQVPESQDSWWGASLISTVLNNIQLILNNVHIRYEDNVTITGRTFNCGIRMQRMTMQTTNSHWKPGFAESQKGVNIFKKLEVTGFSIYWNSQATMTTDIDSMKKLRNVMAPETSSNAYIIQPCSAELRMEKNSSKFPLKHQIPRFKFLMRPEIIVCELTKLQMTQLRALNREWARFERARLHRKWRPLCTIGENAKEWWKFAYNRVMEDKRKANSNRTWSFAAIRAKQLNAYCRAYRRRLIALLANPTATQESAIDPASTTTKPKVSINGPQPLLEDRAIMKQIENDSQYSYHELHLFRETVFRRLVREKEKELGIATTTPLHDETFETIDAIPEEANADEVPVVEPAGGGLYDWITGFFSQQQKHETQEDTKFDFGNVDVGELKENVKEMEDEILDVLHESWDDSTLLRRDALLAQIALRLEHLTLRFVDNYTFDGIEQQRVLALELSGVTVRLEMSPKKHSLTVDLTVQDMSVQRLRSGYPRPKSKLAEITESLLYSTTESTKMLLTIGRDVEDAVMTAVPMFSMHYRRTSPRLITKHVVNCRLRPVNVVYEEGALEGLSTLFTEDNLVEIEKSISGSEEEDMIEMRVTDQLSIIESHILVKLQVPTVRMEVRGRGWSRRDLRPSTFWEPGESLACCVVENLTMDIVSEEMFLTTIQLGFGHIELRDMLENTKHPLFTTSSQTRISRNLSNSCPDLVRGFGGGSAPAQPSKSSNSHDYVSSSVPADVFECQTNLPIQTTMKITSAASIDSNQMQSGPTSPQIGSSSAKYNNKHSAAVSLKPECTMKLTCVDRFHTQFDNKYKKVG